MLDGGSTAVFIVQRPMPQLKISVQKIMLCSTNRAVLIIAFIFEEENFCIRIKIQQNGCLN